MPLDVPWQKDGDEPIAMVIALQHPDGRGLASALADFNERMRLELLGQKAIGIAQFTRQGACVASTQKPTT